MDWTHDQLSTPETREAIEEFSTSVFYYQLMHDTGPNRWYVVRTVLHGMGIRPNGEQTRTPVYSSRNAPALMREWEIITQMKVAHDKAVEVNDIGLNG